MAEYLTLADCPLEGISEFFEEHLSHDIADYPGGIVLPVDKPYRWTSADVVRKCKFALGKHFGQRNIKVGHAGTLDPLATGLLLVCAGKATKVAEELQSHGKEYIAVVEFGATTASFDLEQPIDCTYPFGHITKEGVLEALTGFVGEQEQVPPTFSAKIIGGMRAYEYARSGESVELRKSIITIDRLELLEFSPAGAVPSSNTLLPDHRSKTDLEAVRHIHNYHTSASESEGGRPTATLLIRCSKGTYIRSLARDLGLALGSGAYLTALRRTASGPFKIQ